MRELRIYSGEELNFIFSNGKSEVIKELAGFEIVKRTTDEKHLCSLAMNCNIKSVRKFAQKRMLKDFPRKDFLKDLILSHEEEEMKIKAWKLLKKRVLDDSELVFIMTTVGVNSIKIEIWKLLKKRILSIQILYRISQSVSIDSIKNEAMFLLGKKTERIKHLL
jgi:hypothetical protein